jgi:hypothetical protein
MNIVATRQALATALSSVDGITGYAYSPNAYKAGDAWGQWGGATPIEKGPYSTTLVTTFRVVLVLTADQEAADAFVSQRLDALVDALAPLLAIQGIEPFRLTPDGSNAAYNALVIIGETE